MTNGLPPPRGTLAPATALARMWRDFYKKAAGVAERRTGELIHDHVYRYHPSGAGGGLEGPYVDEVGDTMTGTLHFHGPDVDAGGAIRVLGPDLVDVDARGYGAGSPTFAPGMVTTALFERGMRLRATAAAPVVAVYWYRVDAGQAAPTTVRLWDAAAPGTPLRSLTPLPEFGDTAVGWKAHPLTEAERVDLVAGHLYVVSYAVAAIGTPGLTAHAGYAPVPDAGLEFEGHCAGTPTLYPGSTESDAYGIDLAVGALGGPDAPADTGAIRLPNGDAGVIAWNDAGAGPDHTLTVDEDGQLVYDGVPLGAGGGGTGNATMYTQTTAPAGAENSLWFNPEEEA